MLYTFKMGLILGLSIIISIGAQNLFVIKQGLRNERPYFCAFVCFMSDLAMILLGVTGVSALIMELPALKWVMLVAGTLFLMYYGGLAIKRGCHLAGIRENLVRLDMQQQSSVSIAKLLLLGLSFSILNPQAILDTTMIIGGSASNYADELKYLFVIGTIAASFIWFFGIAVATHLFRKKLMTVAFWSVLEWVSGVLMIGFACKFLWQLWK